jgi:hypothetical protein
MATQEQLDKALCNLVSYFGEINGILALLDLGADPMNGGAMGRAVLLGNSDAVTLFLCMGFFDDPKHQTRVREYGTFCSDEKVRKILSDHNTYAIYSKGWDHLPIKEKLCTIPNNE